MITNRKQRVVLFFVLFVQTRCQREYSSFIVDKMLGKVKKGSIGLYVDIGTVGYFKDLKVTKRALKVKAQVSEKVNGI